MTPSERTRLEAAYLRTTYRAHLPDGVANIRVGQISAALDRWLSGLSNPCWAFVTASNPRSRVLSDEENIARHCELLRFARAHGWKTLEGEGVADQPGWRAERSLLIAGIEQNEAFGLARHFDQLAIVTGRRGAPAQLVWLDAQTR